MTLISPEFKVNFDIAYMVYSIAYDQWNQVSDKSQKRLRRQVESAVTQAGFDGIHTKLISEKAWQTVIEKSKGNIVPNNQRVAKEHPITHKNLAHHCIKAPIKMTYDEYFTTWFDNLVITHTTDEENQRLRKFQTNFLFGVDCWKKMYEDAGIVLMVRPRITKAIKQKYGII